MSAHRPFCDGLIRRDVLRVGVAGMWGLSLSLPEILARQAQGAPRSADDVSLIYLFLQGGMSTIDTFDLKPTAPAEFRGDFQPIATNVPGVQICEHLPLLAQQMDKLSLVRGFGHKSSDHGAGDHYMFTGYHTLPGFNPNLNPNNQRPSFGSIISKTLGPRGSVPPYVSIPRMHRSSGAAYLGASSEPFVVEADPNAPNFAVPDLTPPVVVSASRLDQRRARLGVVERYQQQAEIAANRQALAVNAFQQKAFELMTSSATKQAFDIHQEPDGLRDEYGRHSLGQSCLMARRLVEAGVRCVTITHNNWDTHDNNFSTLKDDLLPMFDRGLSALLRDLADRGRLQNTIILITGEFGRTPRINKNAGRDHWGPASTVALAGGGIVGGRVIGQTDARAEKPLGEAHGVENIAATIFRQMGIDSSEEFFTPEGRPVKIVNNGKAITELL